MFFRDFHPGMGQAVAERTILRKQNDRWETWEDVAKRVSLGNSLLCKTVEEQTKEYQELLKHLSKVTLLMSGRHLQHGDETQPERNQEVFVNCASAPTSFLLFYLLMNGSGVGRCYDDDLMLVNWDYAPALRCVLDDKHADFDYVAHESVRDAQHKYGYGKDVIWHSVGDTREGWGKGVEIYENLAYEKIHKDKLLILDFSPIRCKNSPIRGMQNRPASGPVPLINAFNKVASLKGSGLEPWRQAMYVDHYFAECVLVGGARRAARMSVKSWRDKSIIDFIQVKRPIEYLNQNVEKVTEIRQHSQPMGFLWSSNNSVLVDEEFWECLKSKHKKDELNCHARKVFKVLTQAAYGDGTGEPGIINQDKLVQNREGFDQLLEGSYIGSDKYQIEDDTTLYVNRLAKHVKRKKFYTICNPCSEINFSLLGAFCTIADLVPYFADSIDEAEDAFRVATRALIRVNGMNSVYQKEVLRTNRIGVGVTGVHEFAWKFFGYNFYDLIDEEKSMDFWMTMARFNRAVRDEARKYAAKYGLVFPHTLTCCKPSGTVSKLFGLTEGWHLLAMSFYLRWVQFSENDPLVEVYRDAGYPTRQLKQYKNTIVVGFPTAPLISTLMPANKLVLASEATPEEQYKWLMLGEKYWIEGVDEEGKPLPLRGNSISYTLKYDPNIVDYKSFRRTMLKYQSKVRCCAIMPRENITAYEYVPEEEISREVYDELCANIRSNVVEDISKEHIDCTTGACPVDFKKEK